MDCGIPFCHTGNLISGMASGCPISNLIPEWNDMVYRGLWAGGPGPRVHKNQRIFPSSPAVSAPAPCGGSCVLGITEPPVTIKNLQCSIIDKGWDEGGVIAEPPDARTGKRVVVVGSGPAGLCAAAQLNRAGHWVTVFERADRVGGLLMYGIPNMKLDKQIVQRRIDLMAKEGVTFLTNTAVGRDFPADRLLTDFDAVVLCTGATKPRDLPIEGRELKGIHFAMEFLHGNTKSLLDRDPDGPRISAKDKDVVVIGGGDTGTDCVGTSMRQGCASLTQLEILPQPPMNRAKDNPWPEWPKVYRMDYGQEEAAAKFGADPRVYLTTTKKFVGDEHGHVKEAHTVRIEWQKNAQGQFVPKEVPGSEKVLPAKLVLLAMGFLDGPSNRCWSNWGVERDPRRQTPARILAKFATSIKGVFGPLATPAAAKASSSGPSPEGRGAARECDRYLMGRTDLP